VRISFAGARVFLRKVLTFSLFIATAGVSLAAARDLAVVSNKANSVSALAVTDLMKICKGQTNRWPDGKSVTFVMRSPGNPAMKIVLEKLYEVPEPQVKELVATANHGRAGHPAIIIVDSDEELVNKVASIPGAVGVVDVYSINSSVSVVKLGGKLPLEPGYLLHGN
jgi:ABC-type phosphate transport system substrate-binding protein